MIANRWKWYFVVCLLFSLSLTPVAKGQFEGIDKSEICEDLPNFRLSNLSGEEVFLSDYLSEDHLLLFFWTTWCPHCRRGIKELARIISRSDQLASKIVLINIGESQRRVRKFLSQFRKVSFNVLIDPRGELAWDCRIIGVPTYIVINKKRKVEFYGYYLPRDYLVSPEK